jgi:hypothetical protein
MRKADNFAAAAMPVMPEPRLALIAGGKSDSPDTANNEGGLEPTRSGRIDAPASDVPDEQNGQEQDSQENGCPRNL